MRPKPFENKQINKEESRYHNGYYYGFYECKNRMLSAKEWFKLIKWEIHDYEEYCERCGEKDSLFSDLGDGFVCWKCATDEAFGGKE